MGFTGNKTSLIALSLLFLFVGGALVVAFTGDRISTSEAELPLGAIEYAKEKAFAEATVQDSDKDGLKDWEETLWGTNPGSFDTDGDSTSDGEEVDAGRNPNIVGPEDVLDIENGELPHQTPIEDMTATEKVAAVFFKEYVALRQNGGLSDPTAQAELLQKIVAQFNDTIEEASYTLEDILVGPLSGSDAARSYGNLVAVAIEQNPIPFSEASLVILLKALEDDNTEELKKLDAIAQAYGGVEKDLLEIIAPKDASALHLVLVNQFAFMRKQVEAMEKAFDDPVVMMHSINPHVESAKSLLETLAQLQNYLKVQKASYGDSEPGWFLVNISLPQ